jgi:hypothetical protein
MKIVSVLPLALVAACAGTSASDSGAATSAKLSSQSCAAPLVSYVAYRGAEVHAAPDGNSTVLTTFTTDTPVCAESLPDAAGFRRVRLSDGKTGFVSDQNISG